MKLLTVLGARPQFIKAAMVSRALQEKNGAVKETIVHTGQHYDRNMSELFFDEMKIPKPDHFLQAGGGSHAEMTAAILVKLEAVCLEMKPDALMVYGDTNSTLCGALCASKLHIPVVHVEAGLRSFNMEMPEEINRILTDRVSKLLLCPTQTAIENLKNEGFDNFPVKIILSGDVMLDSLKFYSNLCKDNPHPLPEISGNDYALVTIHRAENTNDLSRLKSILSALKSISEDIPVVLPLHPRSRRTIEEKGLNTQGIRIIDPVGYLDMIRLMNSSKIILTDSGGVQKEAYFCEKPCIILRDQTEWVELSRTGSSQLVGADEEKIMAAFLKLKNQKVKLDPSLFGSGTATERIVSSIEGL